MMSRTQLRMQCLTMANSLVISKSIKPEEALTKAAEYLKFVDDEPPEPVDASGLIEKFNTGRHGGYRF